MSHQPIKRKKFKNKETEKYMKGEWVSEFQGIKNAKEARRRLKITANARSKLDFSMFNPEEEKDKEKDRIAGFRLEKIEGAKDHYSIRATEPWRIFFIWESNQAWEIDLNKHNYKKVKR